MGIEKILSVSMQLSILLSNLMVNWFPYECLTSAYVEKYCHALARGNQCERQQRRHYSMFFPLKHSHSTPSWRCWKKYWALIWHVQRLNIICIVDIENLYRPSFIHTENPQKSKRKSFGFVQNKCDAATFPFHFQCPVVSLQWFLMSPKVTF